MPGRLVFRPLTPARWRDLEGLFGPKGACGGCWCMWWRLPNALYWKTRGQGTRRALKRYVEGGMTPGLLAYEGQRAVGWVAVEPRRAYPRLARSRVLAPVDAKRAWSVTCFYVARDRRGRGLTLALLRAAVAHARRRGARVVEGYPVDTPKRGADAWMYTGAASVFEQAGFKAAARRSKTRPLMRRTLR